MEAGSQIVNKRGPCKSCCCSTTLFKLYFNCYTLYLTSNTAVRHVVYELDPILRDSKQIMGLELNGR